MLPGVVDIPATMTVSFIIMPTLSNCNISVCESYQEQFTIEAEEILKKSALVNNELEHGISYCIDQCENYHRDSCVAVQMDLDLEE